mmetsp:Transcript_46625/g.113606  ORF Transcript_46625/g.113606 Transcript_46625/m.113606 type:complete len:496 (-) Transcript_46625:697-2184(-)
MGTYLSTPVTDKCSEHGESLDVTKTNVVCRWGVVDQQGWRKSMEDAHVAVTDLPLKGDDGGGGDGCDGGDAAQPPSSTEPVDAKVFGVFDGHGGAEVARFCQLYLVSVLKQQPTWKENVTGLPTTPDDPSIPTDPDDLDAAGQTAIGMALRSTFHALDRMIDDPERRQEIMQLRSMKPQLGERREATSIPSPKDISHIVPPPFYLIRPSASTTTAASTGAGSEGAQEEGTENSGNHDDGITGDDSKNTQENPEAPSPAVIENDTDPQKKEDSTDASGSQEVDSATNNNVDIVHKEDDNDDGEESATDDDSERAVGLEEAAEQDRDMMLDSSSDDGDADDVGTGVVPVDDLDVATSSNGGETKTEKLNTMFQKILAMGTARGQVVVSDESTEDDSGEANNANTNTNAQQNPAASLTPPHADTTGGPNARVPTVTHSGRMVNFWFCTLFSLCFGIQSRFELCCYTLLTFFCISLCTFSRYVTSQTMQFMRVQRQSLL